MPDAGKTELPPLPSLVRWDGNFGYLEVKAAPNAPRTEYFGVMADGAVKIRLHAVPEGGRANAALADFLKENLGARGAEVIAGASSSRKVVRVAR